METTLTSNEIAIRQGLFFSVLASIAIWEMLAPRRTLTTSKTVRWFANLTIVFLNATVIRLAFPLLPVGLALLAQEEGI